MLAQRFVAVPCLAHLGVGQRFTKYPPQRLPEGNVVLDNERS
jgi:hypothetical protein